MTDIEFGRLVDLPLREAWKHEAHTFTPWLAENIDHLSEVIGIPLELTGTEVAVESFSADILAQNPKDGTLVLIENQLERTDHTHLGQIMTYLAGLEAQTVVWIAPEFREPHLSAIRWLNEHTADGFSFFAVRARVVRIKDSPFAPIFEIVEKPNDWVRQINQQAKSGGQDRRRGDGYEAFWAEYLARFPDAENWGLKPYRTSAIWCEIPDLPVTTFLSMWIGQSGSGVFVRGGRAESYLPIAEFLTPFAERLETELGAVFSGDKMGFLTKSTYLSHTNAAQLDELIDWFEATRKAYLVALKNASDAMS